ncbi:hypothetical protein GALL_380470 [mine drainage metagenome]|uniref:Uncharacterized protein n=1 Tax=mine drainage metagenome TaxID=410659 RepID=A0A1J5QJQ3_9ZZZZ
MGGDQLDHFAGADEQHPAVGQVLEHGFGQLDAGRCHADRMRADLGRRAHFLGHRERALEHLPQRAAQRAGLGRGAHRVLHLAEDLRLAQHHRIEPAGDAEGMAHGAVLHQPVAVLEQFAGVQVALARQPVDQRLARVVGRGAVDLGAVAGRQDRGLDRAVVARQQGIAQRAQAVPEPVGREGQTLAHPQRGGLVIDADSS